MNDNLYKQAVEVFETIINALNEGSQIFKKINNRKTEHLTIAEVNPLKLGKFAICNSFGGLPP